MPLDARCSGRRCCRRAAGWLWFPTIREPDTFAGANRVFADWREHGPPVRPHSLSAPPFQAAGARKSGKCLPSRRVPVGRGARRQRRKRRARQALQVGRQGPQAHRPHPSRRQMRPLPDRRLDRGGVRDRIGRGGSGAGGEASGQDHLRFRSRAWRRPRARQEADRAPSIGRRSAGATARLRAGDGSLCGASQVRSRREDPARASGTRRNHAGGGRQRAPGDPQPALAADLYGRAGSILRKFKPAGTLRRP